jgi:hypothetical protein
MAGTMQLDEIARHVKNQSKVLIETSRGTMKEFPLVIKEGVACAKDGKRCIVIEGHRLPSGQVVLYFGKLGEFS